MAHLGRFLTAACLFLCFTKGHTFGIECGVVPMPLYGEIEVVYDNFRGIPDGSWNDNTGVLAGANFGVLLYDPFGIQAGGSYGVYDWYGRGSVGLEAGKGVQQQGFVTSGIFWKVPYNSGFQSGLVLDWMFNKNFGVFRSNPSFGQLRLQVGYLLNACNEFGFWGSLDIRKERKRAFEIPVSYRAISQANLYWSHFFDSGAETMLWIGLPYKKSLMFPKKRAGEYIVGGSFQVPLNSYLSIEGHGMYMGPKGNFASRHFRNYNANLCIGLVFAFDTNSECNERYLGKPYLSIANNSNFLVESSFNQ